MEEAGERGGWPGPEQWLEDEHSGAQRPLPAPGMANTAQPSGMMSGRLFSTTEGKQQLWTQRGRDHSPV